MDFTQILTDPCTMALTILLVASLAVLCLYYGLFFFRVGRYKGAERKKKSVGDAALPPVSVVMAAQNDGEWLRTNLVYLLEQDYPDFEVVVVDYLSTDDTQFVLRLLAENYKNLKIVTFHENVNGYLGLKYPLSIGIKSAKNDILLLAEPECMPMEHTHFNWIREMVSGYVHDHIDIVLGYCGITYKPSLFNWLQQYDNLDYSVEYLGAAALRHPFTGNGRNLSYRRSLFMKKDGFIYHYHIPDGAGCRAPAQPPPVAHLPQAPHSHTLLLPLRAQAGPFRQAPLRASLLPCGSAAACARHLPLADTGRSARAQTGMADNLHRHGRPSPWREPHHLHTFAPVRNLFSHRKYFFINNSVIQAIKKHPNSGLYDGTHPV